MNTPLKISATCLAAAALLVFAVPHQAVATDSGLQTSDYSAAKKKKKAKRSQVYINEPARGAYGYRPFGLRNDPSFDPYGRPWRPNFYAPCYEDLGYGRFRDCADF